MLLKLSGETFGGGKVGVDADIVRGIAEQLAEVVAKGTQVAVVMGGGNFFRGAELSQAGMDRTKADYMGMLGTVMNCLALQDFCEKAGLQTRVQSAITMGQVAEPYIPRKAIRHLEKGRLVIFGAGAGMPYFSTDTVAAQRALEIECQVLLMGKNGVDGVYDDDPRINPDAVMYDDLDYATVLAKQLKVADATAISLCMDNQMPIVVFNLLRDGNIARASAGERIGTLISQPAENQPDRPAPRRQSAEPTATRVGPPMEGRPVIDDTLLDAEERMDKALSVAREDLGSVRTGRAAPSMFNKIVVDYYGAPTPVPQMASITVPEARMAVVKPYDAGQLGGHREGHPRQRPGREPHQRRPAAARGVPAAHRGAPPRPGQDGQGQGRGRQGRDPQHPPPVEGGARPHRQGRRGG